MQHFFTFVEVPSSGIGGADTGPSRSQGQESDCDTTRGEGGWPPGRRIPESIITTY